MSTGVSLARMLWRPACHIRTQGDIYASGAYRHQGISFSWISCLIQWISWVIQRKSVHYSWGACTRNATYTCNVTCMYRYLATLRVIYLPSSSFWGCYAWLVMQFAFVTVTLPPKKNPAGLLGGRLRLWPNPVDVISIPLELFKNRCTYRHPLPVT